MAQAQVIAQVSVLSGQAFARDSAGNTRRLKLGDAIREGESVIAADGSKVVLTLADGREMNVRPGEIARIDAEVAAPIKPDASDSSVANNPQGFQKIVSVLKSGGDLDSLIEEDAPAAGLAGQGGNEGHSFVELLRIVETVDPLAFQFGTDRGRPLETIEGAPGQQNAAPDAINDSNSLQINSTATGSVLANDTGSNTNPLTVTGFSVDTNGDGVPENFSPGQTAAIAGVGSLTIGANGTYTFVPLLDFSGPIPVASYVISDGQGGSDTATLALSMIPNADPDAVNDGPVPVVEDTPVNGNVLANDTDPNGNPLTVTGFSIDINGDGIPEQFTPGQTATIVGVGALTIGANGAYSFTPLPNYAGPVPAATYSIGDGQGGTDSAMLVLGPVTPVNDAPVPVVTPVTGNEDTPIALNLSGTDPDGTIQSVTVTALPPASEGVLYLPNGVPVTAGTPLTPADAAQLVFVPAPNYNGPVNIPFTVTDNQGLESAPAVAPITVNPVVDPLISINDVTVNEAAGTMTFTVTLDQPTSATVTVGYNTTDGSASNPADYTVATGSLTFAPGVVTQVVTVNLQNDGIYEGSETFNVNLVTPTNATIADGIGLGTIKDDGTGTGGTDNDQPTLTISNPTVAENGGHAVFTLNLSNPSALPTTVSLALSNGTASNPADYTSGLEVSTDGGVTWTPATSATFAPGVTSVQARTPIVDDNLAETTETFTLTATTTAGVTANPSAVGNASITDNDTPAFSVNDVSVNEGAGTISFTVTLSNPSAGTTTVAYGTTPGTATTADYAAGVNGLTGTLTFAAGVTSQTVTLNVTNDIVFEGPESFNLNLSSATGGAVIADALGIGTILDDGTGPGGSNDDRPQVGSISSPTIAEGGNLDFTVILTHPSNTPTVVTLTPASGSATLGTDTQPLQVSFDNGSTWTPVVGSTVTVPGGHIDFIVRVPTQNDNISEPSETITLGAATAQNAAPVVGTGTITDNDGTPTLTLTGPALVNEAAGTLTYTVTLSNPSSSTVTVGYNTANGSATAGSDYTASSGTLSFAPGETTKTLTVAITNDATYEGLENYSVNLNTPVNASIATGTVSTGIADDGTGQGGGDDDRPQVGSISSPTVVEGGNLDFAVTLTHPSTTPTIVTLTPASGSATLGTDTQPLQVSFDGGTTWTPVVGSTVSVPAGNAGFLVRVPSINDNISEPSETLTLGAATAQNAAPVVGTGTITDNDGTPSLSINDVTVNEAAGTATFTVTLSNPSAGTVTVGYNTTDGSASNPADYTVATGSLTFAPGVVTQVVTVNLQNDGIYEGSETFNVNLVTPTNATIADGIGLGTIKDDGTGTGGTDNDQPTLTISNPTVAENGGHAVFTLNLSNPSALPTTVSLALSNGTASNPADYTSGLEVSTDGGVTWTPATSATFAPGVTSVQARTPIVDDNLAETTETFTLTATTTAGVTANPSAVGNASITDNDTPAFSVNDVSVNEGAGTISFTVTLSNPSAGTTTVAYGTTPGTATTADYAAGVNGLTGTLTFAAGVTSQTVTLNVTNDIVFEGPESFNLNLSSATGGAVIADALGIGTILDDGTGPGGSNDDRPQVGSISSPTIAEGGNLDFTVILTHPSNTPTVVTLTPASGSATLGTDTQPLQVSFDNGSTWTPVVGSTVTVPGGHIDFIVRVPTQNDNISEPSETITLGAATAQNAAPVVGTGTITDNDGTPTLTLTGPALVNEAAGTLTYTVTLSNPSSSTVTVGYNTANGSATAGSDYTASSGTLSFAPGETTKTLTVAITNDATYEGLENYSVNLNTPVNASIATGTVSTGIADDGTGQGGGDDDRPQVGSISSPTVVEGGNLDFAVTLTHPSTTPTIVTLTPASGSATLGTDTQPLQVSFDGGTTWTPVVGSTVSVPAGNAGFLVRVPSINDNISEPSETLTLGAATAQNAAPVVGTGTITDNDGTPSLSINDVTVNEAAGTATFTVTLSNPSAGTVTVGYNTTDGSASNPADYTVATGSLTFAPGVVTQVVTVNLQNDGIYEGSETFNVNLVTPTNATIADGIGLGTIKDDGTGTGGTDNDQPTLTISNPTVAENGGHAVFTLNLSNPSALPTTVSLALSNGTASNPADYTSGLEVSTDGGVTWTPATSATFAPGVTSVQARTPIVDDNLAETTETFTLTATTTAGVTANPSAVGNASITDNDTPAFSVNDVSVNEGAGTISFTVTLSNPSAGTTTVAYGTTPGTATTADYAAGVNGLTGTLTFAAGVTSQTVTLNVTNDIVFEGPESFNLNLSSATGGAVIADALGIGTILDDGTGPGGSNDDRPQVGSISSPTIAEGGNLDFTVILTHPSNTPTVVTLTPASGSATLGTDTQPLQVSFDNGSTWTPVVGSTVTVPGGHIDFIVRVPTQNDNISEPSETITLGAATAQNAAPVVGTGTITDNDGTPTLTLTGPALVNEAAGTLTYTVTLSNPSSSTVTVGYNTANGSATAGSDYTASSGTLSFAPGETTKTLTVAITNDATYEGLENYSVNLNTPVNASIATGTVSTGIADDGTGQGGGDDDRPQVGSISSPTVVEGGNLDFAVTLTHPSTTPTIVTLTPASGSATLGTDTQPLQVSFDGGTTWTPVVGSTVSVPAGNAGFLVRVPSINDNISEPSETLTLGAATAQNAAPVVGTGTITDNDGTPSLSINDVTVNEAAGTATFTVTLSNPSAGTVTVGYNTTDGSASNPADYTVATGSLTFAPGVVTQVVTVNLQNDGIYEGSETFNVNLVTPTNATIADGIGLGTIKDDGTGTGGTDNDQPTLTISNPTVAENGGHAVFTLNLSNPSALPTTVSLALSNGTASNPADYTSGLEVSTDGGVTWTPATSATFAPGVTSVQARTPIVDDNLAETTETFTLTATTTAGVTANPSAVGNASITDNDTPAFSVNDVSVNEGAGTISFTVTLSNPSAGTTTVAYGTTPGTATTADYAAGVNGLTGTLTFAAGVTSQTVTLNVTNDIVFEGPESFNLNLSSATGGAVIADALGIGTILDDGTGPGGSNDDRPQVGSISSPTIAEGGNLDFTVILTHPSNTPTVVTLTPASGSATLGTDTQPLQVSFDNGSTWTPVVGSTVTVPGGHIDFIVRVPTQNDNISEPSETITLGAATAQNAAPVVGTGTITDNDGTPTLTLTGPALVNEAAGTLTYTVTLSNPSSSTVTVGYNTANGSATAGSDYTASSGTLSFAPGETTKTLTVAITNDATYEGLENYTVNLNTPVNASIATGTVSTGIADDGTGQGGGDDDRPQVGSISSPTVVEGGNLDFAVALTHPSTTPTIVTLTPASGSATLGTDTQPLQVSFDGGTTWTPVVGSTVSVPAGNAGFLVRVPSINDNISEPSETLTLGAATAQNAAPVVGTGTITDNDGTPSLSINDVTVNEAAGTATFTVTLSNPSAGTVTVGYNTTDGSASNPADYTVATGSLTFAPGVVTQVVTVNLQNDGIYEGSETFNVNLVTPTNATIADGIGLGAIKDDGTGTGGSDDDRPRVSAISSPTVVEGGNLDFNVTLSNTSTTPTTVTLTPASGTATLGTDTTPLQVSFDGGATWAVVVGTSVSVPPGSGGFIVRVPSVNDALGESIETMTLNASTAQGGAVGTGTIIDNDTPVVNISGPVTYNEAAGTATFTVTLSNASTLPVSVAYATANGSATAGSDYTAGSGTLNFAAGVVSQTITVAIANDVVYEGAETFNVNLSAPSNATLGTAISTATIIDNGTGIGGTNNDAPALSVNSVSVNENAGYAVFSVSLSNPSAIATTVNLGLATGTALSPSDFTNSLEVSTNGGLTWVAANSATFAPGATSLLVRAPVINDTLDEVNETFSLLATRVAGVTANIVALGTATIVDNDSTPVPTADTRTVLEDNTATGNVLTNDTDADGNPLSVTQFTINGTNYPVNNYANLPGIGVLMINSDGSYVFIPVQNWNGVVPQVTYTVSDGTNTTTSTLDITVTPVNDVPVVSLASGAVSEEGLAGGIADALGTSDTTNSATVSGTLVASDVEGDAVTAWNVSVPVGALTSGGQPVSWASSMVSGLTTLTGTAGGSTIATLTLNASGQYTFTLSKPVDHAGANVEDVKILDFAVTVTAGGQTSAPSTLSISVEDDAPAVIPAQVANLAMIDTNLEIVLDISGSMTSTDGVNGQTRLQSAVDSIKTLLDRYDEFGDVHVKLVTFSSGADSRGTGWVTVAQAKTLLDAQVAGGGTNYDEALGDAITAFSETGKLANAQNVAYFFTDGLPTFGAGSGTTLTGTRNGTGYDQSGSDTGIQASEETTWINFLRANQVKAFAVAFGAGVTDTGYIDPIAYDGQTMTNTGGTLVSSFDQLDNMLAGTVQDPVGGQLVSGGLLNAGGLVGADGGFIKSVTIEGTTYTYNPAGTGSISIAGINRGVFDTATNSLTVTTTSGGVFVVDLDNGAYTYAAPPSIASSIVETMNYVVTDKDGDTQLSSITVNVDRTNVVIGTTGAETLTGGTGPDLIIGRDGNDTITGGTGNDQLLAGDGNDTASGGAGNDTVNGGAGTDLLTGGTGSDALTGGLGVDTFRWMLGDATGAPTDTITDFNVALPASGGDILNLQDLLVGETHVGTDPGNLANYLHFSFSSTTGNTTIAVTTQDGASTTQTVVLEGVNLVGAFTTDQQIIQTLLTNGKLITD